MTLLPKIEDSTSLSLENTELAEKNKTINPITSDNERALGFSLVEDITSLITAAPWLPTIFTTLVENSLMVSGPKADMTDIDKIIKGTRESAK